MTIIPGQFGVQKPNSTKHLDRNPTYRPAQLRIVSADKGGIGSQVITVTFDLPFALRGTPNWTVEGAAATLTSATSPSPTVLVLNFSADISAATDLTIPPLGTAVRSKTGGYVADSTFAL